MQLNSRWPWLSLSFEEALTGAGGVKPEEVSKWWQAMLEDDAKAGSLWQNFGTVCKNVSFNACRRPCASSEEASDATATVTKKWNLIGGYTLDCFAMISCHRSLIWTLLLTKSECKQLQSWKKAQMAPLPKMSNE
jgi:hypothetical protein